MRIATALSLALATAGALALSTPAEAQHRTSGNAGSSSVSRGGNFTPSSSAGGNSSHGNWNHGNWNHGNWDHGHWHNWPRGHVNFYVGGFGYPYYYGDPFFGYPYGWGYAPYAYYGYYAPTVPAYTYDPQGIYNGRMVSRSGGQQLSLTAQVQQNLAQAGYYRGAIDGIIGDGTRSAIRSYQRDHGLRINGHINDQLLGSMGLADIAER